MSSDNKMMSSKPYFFRAMYDWIEDNGLTTHIMVDAHIQGVEVPVEYIKGGEIVLNIASNSIQLFENDNKKIRFEARFNGVLTEIVVPIVAIKAVFSRENQQGIFFQGDLIGEHVDVDEIEGAEIQDTAIQKVDEKRKKPLSKQKKSASNRKKNDKSHLKIIK